MASPSIWLSADTSLSKDNERLRRPFPSSGGMLQRERRCATCNRNVSCIFWLKYRAVSKYHQDGWFRRPLWMGTADRFGLHRHRHRCGSRFGSWAAFRGLSGPVLAHSHCHGDLVHDDHRWFFHGARLYDCGIQGKPTVFCSEFPIANVVGYICVFSRWLLPLFQILGNCKQDN
jgi:hypothetical protein